jgi:hypothetical protein
LNVVGAPKSSVTPTADAPQSSVTLYTAVAGVTGCNRARSESPNSVIAATSGGAICPDVAGGAFKVKTQPTDTDAK